MRFRLLTALLPFLACAHLAAQPAAGQGITLYSQRHYPIDRELFRQFEEATGIAVRVEQGDAAQLLQRLEEEGEHSPAGLLVTVDVGAIWEARQRGLLQPIDSSVLKASIPSALRDAEGYWLALTKRPRVLVYDRERTSPEELPSYETLATPAWRGRVAVRSSANSYNQTLLAAMIARIGEQEARNWAAGVVANFARPPIGNDRTQIRAVADGQADVALVNAYYLGLLQNADQASVREQVANLAIVFPNQAGRGTHVNLSAAGIAKHSPHPDLAVRLLEFLTGEAAQAALAENNHEYPANPRVPWPEGLKAWGPFKEDLLPPAEIGRHRESARRLFEEVAWP